MVVLRSISYTGSGVVPDFNKEYLIHTQEVASLIMVIATCIFYL